MRTPVYGELFRSYNTKVDTSYTIKDVHPYKGMQVTGWCKYCYRHKQELMYWLGRNEVLRTKGVIDDAYGNLMPICNSCFGPMEIETLDGIHILNKTAVQTRCKHRGCAGKSFRFRIDPVPRTRCYKNWRLRANSGYKSALIEATKYPQLTRGRRKVNALVENYWHTEKHSPYAYKSWKDCSKKRYQWMKKYNKSKWRLDND